MGTVGGRGGEGGGQTGGRGGGGRGGDGVTEGDGGRQRGRETELRREREGEGGGGSGRAGQREQPRYLPQQPYQFNFGFCLNGIMFPYVRNNNSVRTEF